MPDFVMLNDSYYCVDVMCVPGDPISVKCVLFDMKSIWIQQLPIATVVERENKRNPVCNYSEDLIQATLLTEKAASYSLTSTQLEGNLLTLTIKYYVVQIPVTFEFILRPGTTEELSECVIAPLWRAVLLLDAKNRALKEQLIKKDIEIEQYRAEGTELKRTAVQTTKFEQKLFDEQFPVRLSAENGSNILSLLNDYEQRTNLAKALSMEVHVGDNGQNPSSSSSGPKNSPLKKWCPTVKRRARKWNHQRLDALVTKIKYPNFSDMPVDKRSRMQYNDEEKEHS